MRAAALIAFLTLVLGEPATFPPEAPLPRLDLRQTGPLAPAWTRHRARVTAERVHLTGLGMKTHANWVLFRMPFDPTETDRIRDVELRPSATVPTDVGAIRLGGVCVTTLPYGDVTDWSPYTTSGVGGTRDFAWHPAPPTDDPTIYGVNVPTRVANHVACGREDRLREVRSWILDIEWEAR